MDDINVHPRNSISARLCKYGIVFHIYIFLGK